MVESVQLLLDVTIGTIFIQNLSVVVAASALPFPVIGVKALICHLEQTQFLAFLVGATHWEPVQLLHPIKMLNTIPPQYRL